MTVVIGVVVVLAVLLALGAIWGWQRWRRLRQWEGEADAAFRASRHADARRLYSQALAGHSRPMLQPGRVTALHLKLGLIALARGDEMAATEHVQAALALTPDLASDALSDAARALDRTPGPAHERVMRAAELAALRTRLCLPVLYKAGASAVRIWKVKGQPTATGRAGLHMSERAIPTGTVDRWGRELFLVAEMPERPLSVRMGTHRVDVAAHEAPDSGLQTLAIDIAIGQVHMVADAVSERAGAFARGELALVTDEAIRALLADPSLREELARRLALDMLALLDELRDFAASRSLLDRFGQIVLREEKAVPVYWHEDRASLISPGYRFGRTFWRNDLLVTATLRAPLADVLAPLSLAVPMVRAWWEQEAGFALVPHIEPDLNYPAYRAG